MIHAGGGDVRSRRFDRDSALAVLTSCLEVEVANSLARVVAHQPLFGWCPLGRRYLGRIPLLLFGGHIDHLLPSRRIAVTEGARRAPRSGEAPSARLAAWTVSREQLPPGSLPRPLLTCFTQNPLRVLKSLGRHPEAGSGPAPGCLLERTIWGMASLLTTDRHINFGGVSGRPAPAERRSGLNCTIPVC